MNKKRWIYVILGITILSFAGLIYAWSILSRPIMSTFPEWTATTISFTFTLCMSFFCLGGLLSGIFNKKIGPRINLILSAILFLIGFYLTSTIKHTFTLYLGYGIMAGLASGFAYNTVMTVVVSYFPEKPGLISGILLMGFGIGSFIIGKLYQNLIFLGYDWKKIFFVLGIILFIILFFNSFILNKINSKKEDESEKNYNGIQISPKEMMKQNIFWLFFIWAVLLSGIGLAIISQASGIILQVAPKISLNTIPTIVGMISIFSGLGRVLFGAIFDKIGKTYTMLLNELFYLLALITMLISIKIGNITILTISFIFIGLAYGGVPTTNSAFTASFFGRKYYSINFSIVNMNILLASFGGTLAAKIYDLNSSYLLLIYYLIILLIVSVGITLKISNK